MLTRLDLPPITRRLNQRLGTEMHIDGLDDDTAIAIGEFRSHVVNAMTELENDLIISRESRRAADPRPAPGKPRRPPGVPVW